MTDFVHLHVHTEYSLLDGAARVKDVLDKAKDLGMTALAMTDHGVMYGALEFYSYAEKIGIKPIIGCELYIVEDRFDRNVKGYSHLLLLAKDQTGYRNLMTLVSKGFTEGFYYKPRIDYGILREYSEGLVCCSACLAGDVQRALLGRNYEKAKEYALMYKGIFGDDFYLEIMDHDMPEQKEINPLLARLSKETGIKLIATNDVHYTNKDDSEAQDVLVCIQTGTRLSDEKKLSFETQEFYLKSGDEMAELFPDMPEVISNTLEVADKCNLKIEFGVMHLPVYEIPEGYTDYQYLYEIAEKGLYERYEVTDEIRERFEYEISTIRDMGFVNYFLIVWDFIHYAKSSGIFVGPGRGSAAGSIVAYSLGITDIDPIRYSLLFERFLNPERVSMPDIDTDFCYERRGEIIDYVTRKYGEDRVSQIVTFGTLKARLVIRDVGRVLDVPVAEADRLAKMVPNELKMTIDKALEENPLLAREYQENETARRIIDISRRLEGMPRHASKHAAGVVIADEALQNYVPLMTSNKTEGAVAQYTMNWLESVGLLKMDFLGLRTLTVIRYAIEMIEKRTGKRLDMSKIPLDDKGVYEMLSQGDTDGVFQLESGGMKNLMQDLRPSNINEIMVGIALFRPGPMDFIPEYIRCKNDPKNVKYAHPILKPILEDTYGCLVYQEQVMRMVRDLAGYSMGRSDEIRRYMSKKKMEKLEKEHDVFINGEEIDGKITVEGCLRRGVPEKTANKLFDQMMEFANYAFNKSHACAYAMVTYQTAYLKYYYKVEFWCALLNSYIENKPKLDNYISSIRMTGIPILSPDINASEMKYTVEGDAIRLGFSGISNVGGAVEDIVSEREKNGKYKDFDDFLRRCSGAINKKRLECMILSGCFDSLGYTRRQLMDAYPECLANAQSESKRKSTGQISLFDIAEDVFESVKSEIPEKEEYPKHDILRYEKEMTGMYLSGHPLEEYPEIKKLFPTSVVSIVRAAEEAEEQMSQVNIDGRTIETAGIISAVEKRFTKKKELMARVMIEDEYAQIQLLVFPKAYRSSESFLAEGNIICVKGRVTLGQSSAEIIAESVTPYIADEKGYRGKQLYVRAKIEEKNGLSEILKKYPGRNSVAICFPEMNRTVKTQEGLNVRMCSSLEEDLVSLLGRENVVFK